MQRRKFLLLMAAAPAASQLLPLSIADAQEAVPEGKTPMEPISFSLSEVPFSMAGSYLTLGYEPATERELPVRVSTVRKTAATFRYQTGAWSHDLAGFGLPTGDSSTMRVAATSSEVRLDGPGMAARISFADEDTLTVEVMIGTLRMTIPRAFSWRLTLPGGGLRGFDSPSGYEYRITTTVGTPFTHTGSPDHEDFRLAAGSRTSLALVAVLEEPSLCDTLAVPEPTPPLDKWMSRCPVFTSDDSPAMRHATRVAWFLFWNLQVSPSGGYRRPAILSSKRSLSQVWSWDNLFNAMAVVQAYPELAWDQLLLVLDHQKPDGVLPDTISDARATYGFNKPPLWGWTITRLLPHTPADRQTALLRQVYPAVARLHRWWLRERDLRGDGVPAYLSGNDSGWDNSTIFAEGLPTQSPDLLGLLILDAKALAAMADQLALPGEAAEWRNEAARMLSLFNQTFVRNDELVFFVQAAGGWQMRQSTSLLTRIPILLGEDLLPAVRRRMVAELGDPALFAAPYGPASEALNGPLYAANGYWRGPVWGPSTFLIAEGLRQCGEHNLARTLGERYRRACAREATFRENYDAVSGAGQYDSGMTWAAADYLLLGRRSSAPGVDGVTMV